jgi:hypothetical protein
VTVTVSASYSYCGETLKALFGNFNSLEILDKSNLIPPLPWRTAVQLMRLTAVKDLKLKKIDRGKCSTNETSVTHLLEAYSY